MIVMGGENVRPDVEEVAVVGVPDEDWGETVKACVVPAESASLSETDVAEYVAARLASYKKPRRVEFYDELPRNPTGKVLKSELT